MVARNREEPSTQEGVHEEQEDGILIPDALEPAPEPEDIPEPPVPSTLADALAAAVHEVVSVPVEPSDIPVLPTSAQDDAVLHAFCQRLQTWMMDYHTGVMRMLDDTLVAMRKWVETTTSVNEHQGYQLAGTLETLTRQGIPVITNTETPYQVRVSARSPEGYGVEILVQKDTAATLISSIPALTAWLHGQHYTAITPGESGTV